MTDVTNDWDSDAAHGANGSVANLGGGLSDDSYIETVVANAGLYYVVVGTPAAGNPFRDVVPDGVTGGLHRHASGRILAVLGSH